MATATPPRVHLADFGRPESRGAPPAHVADIFKITDTYHDIPSHNGEPSRLRVKLGQQEASP